jgi:hypothetical protein
VLEGRTYNSQAAFGRRQVLMEEGGEYPVLADPRAYRRKDGTRLPFTREMHQSLSDTQSYGYEDLNATAGREARQIHWKDGSPVSAEDQSLLQGAYNASMWSVAAMVDWNADGKQDLVLGDFEGEIYLIENVGTKTEPVFPAQRTEVRIGGEVAVPGHKAAVSVADWDSDGLFDLLSGSGSGAVYFFRNSGSPGKPRFVSREQIIGESEPSAGKVFPQMQWLERGESPRRGNTSMIQAVDYNRDGKLDLLVGDTSITLTPRYDLLPEEEKQMRVVRAKMDEVWGRMEADKSAGREWDNKKFRELSNAQNSLIPYLEKYDSVSSGQQHRQHHGLVWVYLRQ